VKVSAELSEEEKDGTKSYFRSLFKNLFEGECLFSGQNLKEFNANVGAEKGLACFEEELQHYINAFIFKKEHREKVIANLNVLV